MHKVGIVCDLSFDRHHLFRSYYYSIANLFKQQLVVVKGLADLEGIDILVLADDHYCTHKDIWQHTEFIDCCNTNKITVVALTNERILDSFFPWNKDNLLQLNLFDHLIHYATDVDDCRKLGCRLNRSAMSVNFQNVVPPVEEKKDKILFLGKTICDQNSYRERKQVLRELSKMMEVVQIESDIPVWKDYMKIISEYRFIFSPVGNGNFFTMRFYEALTVGSIPVHQVRDNTLDYYDIEAKFDDCLFFQSLVELKDKFASWTLQRSYNRLWMEDNLGEWFKKDGLIYG